MKIAYIFDDKNVLTGAHHINRLIVEKLRDQSVEVTNFYPTSQQGTELVRFKGLKSILFYYSLIEQKKRILSYDLIQGTTYTPLSFLGFGIPVVCHFGSTTLGFLKATPQTYRLESGGKEIIHELKDQGVLTEVSMRSRRPLRDIAEVELYTALLADAVIATSELVKQELANYGVPPEKISVIHNSIEDYWFEGRALPLAPLELVFLGRIANDVFTWKLKGVDRLIRLYRQFPKLNKTSIFATTNILIAPWLDSKQNQHTSYLNLPKEEIHSVLRKKRGSVVLLTSRYEGFSLSLVEAMSQGLIPVAYPVGVVPELIQHGVNGFIVRTLQEARKAIQILSKDEEKRRLMSAAAAKSVRHFRGEAMALHLKELYEKVINTRGESAILEASSQETKSQASIDIEWAATTAEEVSLKIGK